jgi:energy-coupling factor transporter ATP-binding protein EcfA2
VDDTLTRRPAGWPRSDDPRWGLPPGDDPAELADAPAPRTAVPDEKGPDESAAPDKDVELVARLAALARAAAVAEAYASPEHAPALAAAAELAERGASRLALRGYTVVALAGPTGAGKSSLFNALTGLELSPPGHLRPTTGEAYACVWDPAGADALLDWLGVAPRRRFGRESPLDADDEAARRGLILIDLPDLDSIAARNRIEADRLVQIVDRVVWVLDPQKYADQALHEYWRRRIAPLREATVVVLNQADTLAPADAERCRADLSRLIAEEVPVIATSVVTGAGLGELRQLLERSVADRLAAAARLRVELDEAVARLAPLAPGPAPTEQELSAAVPQLADDLAAACGIDTLAVDAVAASRPRWPWSPERADPAIPPADPAAVGQAVRRLADQVGASLPQPWAGHLRAASTMDLDRLPDELALALRSARGLDGPAWPPRRQRASAVRRMHEAVLTVAREVVAPVRLVLRDYAEVQTALERARGTARE